MLFQHTSTVIVLEAFCVKKVLVILTLANSKLSEMFKILKMLKVFFLIIRLNEAGCNTNFCNKVKKRFHKEPYNCNINNKPRKITKT